MFAVTAITGKVGGAVARTLLAAGHPVRAVVRSPERGAAWAARGCEVAVADVSDAGPLATALAGVEAAFILLPPVFDPAPDFADVKPAIAVIKAALAKAKPGRLVVLSTIGADSARPNLLNSLRFLEEALSDLPLPITFLRAAWFMENASWDVTSARDQGVIHSYLQPLDRPVPMIATDDVGRLAAELMQQSWSGRRIVELEAAERVSPDQLAAAFGRALGRRVVAQPVPRGDWQALFREQGMQNPTPRMQMIDGFNEGWIDFRDGGVHACKGRIPLGEAIAALVRSHPGAA